MKAYEKIFKRAYSRKTLGILIGIISLLLILSATLFYLAEHESRFYFRAVFMFAFAIILYFITLFSSYGVEIDFEKQTILIQYPYSFKGDKIIQLADILGYYIYADDGFRRIVLVLKDKSELKFSDSYDSFFKQLQAFIFENYQMISHKNYNVYSDKRKAHELHVYNSLPPIISKAYYEHETFKLHAFWTAGVLGLLCSVYYLHSIFNVLSLISLSMIVISYFWIKSRKAKLNSKNKDEWDGDLFN